MPPKREQTAPTSNPLAVRGGGVGKASSSRQPKASGGRDPKPGSNDPQPAAKGTKSTTDPLATMPVHGATEILEGLVRSFNHLSVQHQQAFGAVRNEALASIAFINRNVGGRGLPPGQAMLLKREWLTHFGAWKFDLSHVDLKILHVQMGLPEPPFPDVVANSLAVARIKLTQMAVVLDRAGSPHPDGDDRPELTF